MLHKTIGSPCLAPDVIEQSDSLGPAQPVTWLFIRMRVDQIRSKITVSQIHKLITSTKWLSPNVSSLDSVKLLAEMSVTIRTLP